MNLESVCWVSPRHVVVPLHQLQVKFDLALAWLSAQQPDVDVERTGWTISGVARSEVSYCCFSLIAHKASKDTTTLEFSHTSGCVVLLNYWWNLLQGVLARQESGVFLMNLKTQDTQLLATMAQQGDGDMAHQSLQILAAASSNAQNLQTLVAVWPDVHEWVLDALTRSPPETMHCLCKLLVSLAKTTPQLDMAKVKSIYDGLDVGDVQLRSSHRYLKQIV